jgi:SAM-dependent methyltransferase
MGILASHIHFLAKENKIHAITGDVLTLGQQSVHCTLEHSKRIIASYGISIPLSNDMDTRNKIPQWRGTKRDNFMNAEALFTLLGAKNVYVCDYSPYENADFVFDLNYPVDEEFKEKFDVIFDAGTLEHVFDLPMALANINYMLKKGGRVIVISPASNAIDHGFYSLSPTLFFDYFSAMRYNNFSCYLRESEPFDVNYKGRSYKYDKVGDQMIFLSRHSVEVHFYATKGAEDATLFEKPIQSFYKNVYKGSSQYTNSQSLLRAMVKPVYNTLTNIIPGVLQNYFQKRRSLNNNLRFIGKF